MDASLHSGLDRAFRPSTSYRTLGAPGEQAESNADFGVLDLPGQRQRTADTRSPDAIDLQGLRSEREHGGELEPVLVLFVI